MRECIFFESLGTVVVAVRFMQTSDKVAHFNIVQAVDYPDLDHDGGEEIATVNYFNFIGQDGEVVESFGDGNLIASGNIVLQFPEDKVNPISYTIELQSGIIFNGKEFNDLVTLIQNHIQAKAFLFLSNEEFGEIERVKMDFTNV